MRRMSWLVALLSVMLLAGVPGCRGQDFYIGPTHSDSTGSWFQVTNDAGYIGDETGDYRTKH
jgi:hypothetical protein